MFEEFNLDNFEDSKNILEQKIKKSRADINNLLEIEEKTYFNFSKPYQEIAENLNEFLTPIFHIDSVKNSKITQKIHEECIPLISEYETELSQDENVYSALKDIQYNHNTELKLIQDKFSLTTKEAAILLDNIGKVNDKEEGGIQELTINNSYTINDIQYNDNRLLNNIQLKVVDNEIRDFKLGGCGLDISQKTALKDINLKLSELSNKFSQNLLDSTNAYEMIIDDFEDVKEIPQSDLDISKFEEDGKTKYKFTLQMPSYLSYITYGSNRSKREEIYKAYNTRAPQNGKIIIEILKLKSQRSNILGFDNYAQYSIETKMAKNEKDVVDFLEELARKGKSGAVKEFEEVKKLAFDTDKLSDLKSYDLAYYGEKLKHEKYDLDAEYYRPYFEQDSVLNGFFDFLYKMFNIKFIKKDVNVWDDKAKVYDILEDDKIIARIFIDLESRKDKSGGAWMNNWHTHYINCNNEKSLPTAYIVCNFPPSTKDTASLLRHDDVVTLFHEMGHALHHLLSKIPEPFVSGISGVAWDVVEFPSQFLEYFAYDKDVLKMFAKHYKTGEVLDDEAINRLIKAKNFQSSLSLVRQVELALFDFKLYQKLYKTEEEVQDLLNSVREQVSVIKPPHYNKFQNGFAHIFSGGYSAGYYSYKWAEVLSADAFYLFLDSNVFNGELALKYKDLILGQGGSIDMDKLFFKLANRNPSVDSLLKIDGIIS